MKIALLGPTESGKTVYFAALARKYQNFVGFRPLSAAEQAFHRQEKVDRRLALQIEFTNAEHEAFINTQVTLLSKRPISEWPDATLDLDGSDIRTIFHFADAFDLETPVDQYRREIAIYDPPGAALSGRHMASAQIVQQLKTCDVAIVFLPAELILEAVEADDADHVLNGASFGKIREIIEACASKLGQAKAKETLPVCFVISKADKMQNLPETVINQVSDMLYNHIIKPLSRSNPNMTICVCPVSVIDPSTGNFEASNLEWPFLFAAAGTIFRNSFLVRDQANVARKKAKAAEASAEALRSEGWTWNRLKAWWNDDGVRDRMRRAAAYSTDYGRLVGQYEDDRALAKACWKALGIEGKARQVRVFAEGRDLDLGKLGDQL